MRELMGSTGASESKNREEAKIEYMFNSLEKELEELEMISRSFIEGVSSVLKENDVEDKLVGLSAVESGHSGVYYKISELIGKVVDLQHLLINAKSRLEI